MEETDSYYSLDWQWLPRRLRFIRVELFKEQVLCTCILFCSRMGDCTELRVLLSEGSESRL